MAKLPSIRDRMSMALDLVSGRAFRRPSEGKANGKPFQFAWPAWRDGQAQWRLFDYQTYADEGFNRNSLIYSAIMYKCRSITQAPLRAYTGTLDNPVALPATHELARLTNRPNPHQSFVEYQQQATAYLNIAGENFTVLRRDRPGKLPSAMYCLRPDRVRIVPGDGGIMGYVYIPEGKGLEDGIPILPTDMIHVKLPNPLDPLEGMGHGLSPISAMAYSADVDNMVTEFLKLFFQRGAVPQGILEFEVALDEPTWQMVRDRWQDQYGGYQNWVEVGVLDRGAKYNRMGLTFAEMDFTTLDDRNEARILGPFGVPSILLGTRMGLDRGTESNVEELRRMFWQDTLIPELILFETEYQFSLMGDDGSFLLYDVSQVPALQRNVLELVDAAVKLFAIGVPRNLAFQTVGLQVETTPDGDVSFMSNTYMLAEDIVNPPAPPPQIQVLPPGSEDNDPPPQLPSGDDKEGRRDRVPPFPVAGSRRFSPEQKAWLTHKVSKIAESWEGRYGKAAKECFDDQHRGLSAILNTYKSRKASVNWESVEQDWKTYIANDDQWRYTFYPLLRGLMEEQGQQWATTLGLQFDLRNLDAENWFQNYTLTFAQPINETTSKTLHDLIAQAMAEGWSIQSMQNQMALVFQQWMLGNLDSADFAWYAERMPDYRRELIARVETMRASNAGSFHLFDTWDVTLKEWASTNDSRTRDTHRAAGSAYRQGGSIGPIPMGDPFTVGDSQMMYPLDTSMGAALSEIMDCRCTVLPFMEE